MQSSSLVILAQPSRRAVVVQLVMQAAQPSSPLMVRPDAFPSSPPNIFPSTDLPRLHRFSNLSSPTYFGSEKEFDSRMIAIAEEVEFQRQQAQFRRDQAYAQNQAQEESQAV